MQAEFEEAGSLGFRPLLEYISGKNQVGQQVSMTAPVVQSSKIEMTAPVIQSPVIQSPGVGPGQDEQVVAFVLPASMSLQSAPVPTDSRVTLRETAPTLTAVSRYSGRWSQASYEQHVSDLRRAITADGLLAVGEPRFARFDPPFKPWFLRRNEVHIDVQEAR